MKKCKQVLRGMFSWKEEEERVHRRRRRGREKKTRQWQHEEKDTQRGWQVVRLCIK
jgi:hypothetical protein